MARKNDILSIYTKEVEDIKAAGLFKGEVPIVSPQSAKVQLEDGRTVINMCANNYLGLGDNQRLIDAAKRTYDERGYGVASVRFICGTQDIHKQLEKKISGFLGTDDTILYSSCFDANGGLFETILTADDAVISDELNHASIIDGVRLCKAKRFRYKNNDMADLEAKLKEADEAGARIKLIATDGVFSMDGIICNLKGVCDLADKYNALVMVDDSHAVGFVGKHGRGTAEHCGVEGRVDIITGTLGTFAQPTNVDTKARIIAYDIRELGEQLMPIGMLVTLDAIYNRVIQNWKKGKTTWIFADEFYLLFRYQYSADFFYRLYKRIRKYQGFVTGLTQNVEELLKSDTARLMLANSEFLILLNQATTDRDELASLLNISENQLSYITNVGAGKGLIRCSGNLVPFENSFPKNTKLYRLMTTKPGEC